MDRYKLSIEGKSRFRRKRISANAGTATLDGYEIVNFIFENGPATREEIENHTGLSPEKVTNKLSDFIYSGYLEKMGEAPTREQWI